MKRKTVYLYLQIYFIIGLLYMDTLQTKIVHTYKKISTFVFHSLIFLFALVIALFIFQRIISQPATINVFQSNENILLQKTKLIAEFSKFLKQNIKDNDLNIYILQWDLQTENWFITSVNNLIDYKWFVVPRYFYMYTTIPVKSLEYFSGDTYETDELENFVNTFIFTKKITVKKPFTRVYLPIGTTLVDDFNLSCVFENKLSNTTCNYFLNDFLDSFFIYNISSDYAGLKTIFDAIKNNTTQKWKFCEWLSKYLLYANDESDPIQELFGLCGQKYEDLFKRTTLFMEIQSSLENQSFEKTAYKDIVLNQYKLLSYQQQLYQDFLVNKADTYKITSYLDFVKEVLKKNAIEPFYKDEIYRYNNKYLAPALENLSYQSTIFTQNVWWSKISALLTTIHTLNEWEPMLWFSGLIAEIQNKTLITQINTSTWTNSISTSIADRIATKLKSISYLTIEKQSISDSIIDIVGYLKFFSPDKNETIKSHIILEYKNDMLLVKSVELQNKAGINDVIKNLLLIQNFSIGELYSYIAKNLVFYEQEDSPISASLDLCPELKTIKNISISSCTNNAASIKKNTIQYNFTFENGGIANISISDKTLENAIKTSYTAITDNNYSLIKTIQAIVNYELPSETHEWTTNAIVVFEKIQQYMGIKANDIADNNGKILVDISLGGINFIVNYVLSTNTLGPWYFKDILSNGTPYMIQNLNLPLDDWHQNTINSFVIDPLTAIQNADLTARQNYQEFIKQSK